MTVDPSSSPLIIVAPDVVDSVRGRTCWTWVFSVIAVIVSTLFGVVIGMISTKRHQGSLAGLLAGGALMCCFVLFYSVFAVLRSKSPSGSLSLPAAVQYFIRGAVISVNIAVVLELTGMAELHPNPNAEFRDAPIALIVGFAEEVGKLFVVVAGACIAPGNLPVSILPENSRRITSITNTYCCTRMWALLIESPRALAMAGIAAGFGFMTAENIEYFAMIFSTITGPGAAIAAVMRIFLNLHPLLTGLAAARLAHLLWVPTSPTPRTISLGKIGRAILPSILIHAMFDFGLMFSASNPSDDTLDTAFILTSLSLIPTSFFLLIRTYRSLPTYDDLTQQVTSAV